VEGVWSGGETLSHHQGPLFALSSNEDYNSGLWCTKVSCLGVFFGR